MFKSVSAECRCRCTAAPHPCEAARFELVGDAGRKNGEKKLRSLLCRTAEWASSDARDAAAEALQAVLPRLADALRARASYMLSKQLLFALLGFWAYRSDAWRRRGNRTQRQPAPTQLVVAPRPPPSLELADFVAAGPLQLDAVWLHLRSRLQPLMCEAERLMLGPAAKAVASRGGDLSARRFVLAELQRARGSAATLAGVKVPRFQELLAEARAVEAESATAALPAPMLQIEAMLAHYASVCVDMVRDVSARLAVATQPLEQVALSEELSLTHILRDVVERMADLLRRSRERSTALYAGCAALCGEMLVAHMVAAARVYEQRTAWLAALGHDAEAAGWERQQAIAGGGCCGGGDVAALMPGQAVSA